MIATDTSSLVSYLRNEEGNDVSFIRNAIINKQLVLPPVVLSEILSDVGLPNGIRERILQLPVLEIMPGYWVRVGHTRTLLQSKKLKARIADALIAQSCIDHQMLLITRDSDFRHFKNHCNLEIIGKE